MSIPGYDLWKQASPFEDEVEPSRAQYDAARAELGAEADVDEVYERACELMQADIDAANEAAEEAEADSRNDDRDEEGDGPWN
jgi:hypothetical protein